MNPEVRIMNLSRGPGEHHLLVDDVIVSIEWREENLEELYIELTDSPEKAVQRRDSCRVLQSAKERRFTREPKDIHRSPFFCELGEHTLDEKKVSDQYCLSPHDIRACSKCYIEHLKTFYPQAIGVIQQLERSHLYATEECISSENNTNVDVALFD